MFNDSDPFLLSRSFRQSSNEFVLPPLQTSQLLILRFALMYPNVMHDKGSYFWFGLLDLQKIGSLAAALPGKREARYCATNGQDGGNKDRDES